MKREPTDTWIWLERVLRSFYGDSWQHRARQLFLFRAGELRPALDFDLAEDERRGLENVIYDAMCQRADDLRMQAALAAAEAEAFAAECMERRGSVWAQKVRESDDEAEAIMLDWCADNVEGYEKEAA